MITFLGKFFSGIFLAVSSVIWPVATPTPATTTTAPQAVVASSSATVVETVNAPTSQPTPKVKTVEAVQTTPVVQAPVIQTPVIPVTVVAPTPIETAPVQSAPATTRYYENGSYVELTDAQHQALLQQVQTTIQQLQSEEQSYASDIQSVEAKVSAACASVMATTHIEQGLGGVAQQTEANICTSTSQAYEPELEIDNSTIASYNAKINAIKSDYN